MSLQTVVLNILFDSTSLDTVVSVADFFASQSFHSFFKVNVKNVKKRRFFDLQYIFYSNESLNILYRLQHCYIVL